MKERDTFPSVEPRKPLTYQELEVRVAIYRRRNEELQDQIRDQVELTAQLGRAEEQAATAEASLAAALGLLEEEAERRVCEEWMGCDHPERLSDLCWVCRVRAVLAAHKEVQG